MTDAARAITVAIAVASGALAAGCDSDGPGRSPMEGQWSSGDPATAVCAQSWTFDHQQFDVSIYCQLDNGATGLDITRGTFVVNGDHITLTKTRSTCANESKEPNVLTYLVDRGKLTLVTPNGVYTLARGGLTLRAGASATFGCFDEMGHFTPGMLVDL
jgi:hypothetical protein